MNKATKMTLVKQGIQKDTYFVSISVLKSSTFSSDKFWGILNTCQKYEPKEVEKQWSYTTLLPFVATDNFPEKDFYWYDTAYLSNSDKSDNCKTLTIGECGDERMK